MRFPPFQITMPKWQSTPIVFSSPHSGRNYPTDFLQASVLDKTLIRSSEDAFVDDLIASAPDCGAPLICATFPRAYLDLNRNSDELDPALIEGVACHFHNPRVASGLGIIPRVVAQSRAIQRGKVPLAVAQERIVKAWLPYHIALRGLLDVTHWNFGKSLLLDFHSMPQNALPIAPDGHQVDIVLGDRFGCAADETISDFIAACFEQMGLKVARNEPFSGAYITKTYGKPARNQHAVQIEINRALYMDEVSVTPKADFAAFRQLLADVILLLTQFDRDQLPLAGE
jgi:N-formylglutamate amidohydrolase